MDRRLCQRELPLMFIVKGMEEPVSNWMSVILVHLTTCGRNSEPEEQQAGGTTGRRNNGAAPTRH